MFFVIVVLSGIIVFAVLDLAKNTVIGWAAAAIIILGLILGRHLLRRRGSWSFRTGAVLWLGAVILLVLDLILTGPPTALVPAVANRDPEITEPLTIAQGQLTGVWNADRSVRVYAGIPFAKPPVGALRWKEPADPEPWEGIRACDHFQPEAMQSSTIPFMDSLYHLLGYHDYRWFDFSDNYRDAMSEDCLYLNVYAPADAKEGDALPVLVYIHGGSLTTGQPWYTEYRGEDLARQGIVVVNVAYRVNIFGYLALEELAEESPNGTTGNYGLLDQIQSLKWVRDNISVFGGDPDQVTLAGESAGASSVNALCVSPLAEGLFRRVIAESSSILAYKPYHTLREKEDALAMGEDILKEFNVTTVEQLRALPADKLEATSHTNSAMIVDGYAITEQPYLTYQKGENHEEALLNGFNAHEADAFMMGYKATKENYIELIEPIFGAHALEAAELVPPGSVEQFQPFLIDAKGEAKGALNKVYSAAWFTYSHYLWTNYMLQEGRPVYEYCFTKSNKSLSSFHAGELPYAYGNLWRHDWIYEDSDRELSEKMQKYWVNFVKYGDPNAEGLPVWPASTGADEVFELGEHTGIMQDPYLEIYALLDRHQADLKAQDEDGREGSADSSGETGL